MIDLEKVRSDTPSCAQRLHFNNAGASPMPEPVYEAVLDMLRLEKQVGGYEAAAQSEKEIGAFYDEFAALLNAAPDEMAFAENATRAWDMAFYGLGLKAGDRIITHASEYASSYLAFLQMSRNRGVMIDVAPSDETGQIDVAALENLIGPRTRLIAIPHVPTQGGLINPAAEVGEIARRNDVFYILDACQSVGQLAVDVERIGCDALTGTGRKYLRGPRGTGFLYVRRSALDRIEPPFIDLHAARWTGPDSYELADGARRFEGWECNVAGKVGLARAARYARQIGLQAIEARVTHLGAGLRGALSSVKGVTLHDLGARKCGLVTFGKAGCDPRQIASSLRAQNIFVSVSSSSSSVLDLGARGLDAVVRASVHYFNTDGEISRFAEAVDQL